MIKHMKAVLQRVLHARLKVNGETVSEIGKGYVVYFGVRKGDTEKEAEFLAKKIVNLRIFEDENGKINRSIKDVDGQILFVSQFTLYANASHGNRPDFLAAEEPVRAEQLYRYAAKLLKNEVPVQLGVFGADMKIDQLNDGPFTLILEKRHEE